MLNRIFPEHSTGMFPERRLFTLFPESFRNLPWDVPNLPLEYSWQVLGIYCAIWEETIFQLNKLSDRENHDPESAQDHWNWPHLFALTHPHQLGDDIAHCDYDCDCYSIVSQMRIFSLSCAIPRSGSEPPHNRLACCCGRCATGRSFTFVLRWTSVCGTSVGLCSSIACCTFVYADVLPSSGQRGRGVSHGTKRTLKWPHLKIIARWQGVKWIYLISDRYNRITRQLKVRWSLGGEKRGWGDGIEPPRASQTGQKVKNEKKSWAWLVAAQLT